MAREKFSDSNYSLQDGFNSGMRNHNRPAYLQGMARQKQDIDQRANNLFGQGGVVATPIIAEAKGKLR